MASTTTTQHNKEPPNVVHLSHPHPLECTKSSSSSNNVTCFGCKQRIDVDGDKCYYNCKPCSFSLHKVCYRMPLITKHPSHSSHDLVLLVIPSSPATLKCMACGNHVTGFCYHCAECSSIFFHTFCLALPLSISLTNHPHTMDLAFTPPYDFFCDLCNNKTAKSFTNDGWLYRCSMCEFDTHIGCAVHNIDPQSNNALMMGQLQGTGSSMIMRLVARQIGCGGNRGREQQQQHHCDSMKLLLNSPRRIMQKRAVGIGTSKLIELEETSGAASDFELQERTPLRDQSTPLSDTHTPSHQFSEAYFSIDLARSYSASAAHNSKKEDTIGSDADKNHLSVVASETIIVNNSDGSQGKKKEETFGVVNYFPSNDVSEKHQNKLNSAIFEGLGESNQKVLVKNSNDESLAKRRSIKDQAVPKSDSKRDNMSSSGWRKCLPCL